MSFAIFLVLGALSLCYAAYWSKRAHSRLPFVVMVIFWIAAFVFGCIVTAMR